MTLKNQKGFTLIELLVVIAIIGILAAIAIPQFAQYRANAYCSRVESDVANAIVAMEGYYAENDVYATDLVTAGLTASKDVTLSIVGTTPLTVSGTDVSGNCPKGGTYTIAQGAQPTWAP